MRSQEEKLRVELAAAKDLADFRANQLAIAMGKYDGPDGARRIELLEELASVVSSWIMLVRPRARLTQGVVRISAAIDRDNERVDRLKGVDKA